MRLREFAFSKEIKGNIPFQWTDYEFIQDVDQRLAVAEAYYASHGNLLESNEPDRCKYFLSLTSLSSTPAKNKPFILVLLGMVNNKVVQLQYPEVVKIISENNGVYTIERSDGSTGKFPDQKTADKMVAATFLFDNTESYNKFRSILLLKFDTTLADAAEVTGNEDEQLNELSFMGSQCTKDCSGHRAGYSWYKKRGYEPASWSNSFNNGAAIAASGR
jgi:hypothetical protein